MVTTVVTASASRRRPVAGAAAASPSRRSAALEQLLVELRLRLRAPVLGDQLHLLGGHEGALHAQHAGAAEGTEQHVAFAEQALGAALVEDDARVGLRGDGEGDARRDVRLDEAGDDVHRRPLRGDHHVDAGARGRAGPRRMMASSTSSGATIMRSASSSMTSTMYGSGCSPPLLELLVELAESWRCRRAT